MKLQLASRQTAAAAFVLLVAAACSANGSFASRGTMAPLANLLKCPPQPGHPPTQDTATIGARGGKLKVHGNQLDIPKGALQEDVLFTIRELSGDSVGVEITPSTQFAELAEVKVDVGHSRCEQGVDRDDWWMFRDGQPIPTKRPWYNHRMIGQTDHVSYFIIGD
jgi:hypothetical protein